MTRQQRLWSPTEARVRDTILYRFMAAVRERSGAAIHDYGELYDWSVKEKEVFWSLLWDFCGVIGEKAAKSWPTPMTLKEPAGFRMHP